MRHYTLAETCALFHVDPATLRRWLSKHRIVAQVDAADHRLRYLSEDQLLQLAELHHRVLIDDQALEACPACAVLATQLKRLAQRVAELERASGQSACATASEVPGGPVGFP